MSKEIIITERAGIPRRFEYVRVALPCRRGELPAQAPLRLVDDHGAERPHQSKVLKSWPDGSPKWVLLDFAASVEALASVTYRVDSKVPLCEPLATVTVTRGRDSWQVDTGAGRFVIDSATFRPFVSVVRGGKEVLEPERCRCLFSVDGDSTVSPAIRELELEEPGPLHAVVRVGGVIEPPTGKGLRFSSRLHFFAGSMVVRMEFTAHNPHPARHRGGLWDLGDPGSVLFKELAFGFGVKAGAAAITRLVPEPGADVITSAGGEIFLYQESSGGENWRSANHRNRRGEVPFTRRGYLGSAGERTVAGHRATPVIWRGAEGGGLAVAMQHFWQEFPKAFEGAGDGLKVALFPKRYPDLHELQGGERKSHVLTLDFAATEDALDWAMAPLHAAASPDDYRSSGIFPDLPGEDDLVDAFCTAADFVKKREALDEYGWRNFGEIYADHEAVYHQGAETFVSHYNNQYDFLAGLYRKAFATADFAWREVADDLARHLMDIDIYHTEDDREEYNHGLFWHTDHYIDAGLSTHRTSSREHLKVKDRRYCGGGPGAEHCYTTGLLLRYYHTGDPACREAVIALAKWCLISLTGTSTVLGALKRSAHYVSLLRGARNRAIFPRYPLTRGTGNAIAACLDAFEVGGGRTFLEQAEALIRGSVHAGDDIAARDLLRAETAWSYTVLLGAIGKYLDKKASLDEFDQHFRYARASLLAYAEWMAEHEYPYLEKPEILAYPNETWAAQDLRKSVVLHYAARYCEASQRDRYLSRARHFFAAAREELTRRPSSTLTRPLALMLQNGWIGSALAGAAPAAVPAAAGDDLPPRPTPRLTAASVFSRIVDDLCQATRATTVKREWAWLRARLS